jgi:hypothetical protein
MVLTFMTTRYIPLKQPMPDGTTAQLKNWRVYAADHYSLAESFAIKRQLADCKMWLCGCSNRSFVDLNP